MEIDGNTWKELEIDEIDGKRQRQKYMEIHRNKWNQTEIDDNKKKLIKINRNRYEWIYMN